MSTSLSPDAELAAALISKSGHPLLPLVMGVTGHRDLRAQDVQALEEAVGQCLDELKALCPHTPLVLLSPLAEGADRLVARVALSKGVHLVVPLPLPRDEYIKDFDHAGDEAATQQSLAEFDGLMRRAAHRFEVKLAACNTPASVANPGPERNHQYLQVGASIVRNSYILLALWDGDTDSPQAEGGTSQIVQYGLSGLPDALSPNPNPLDAADAGPVVQIATPRARRPRPQQTAFSRSLWMPGAWEDPTQRHSGALATMPMAATLHRHDAYNADIERLGARLSSNIEGSRSHALQADSDKGKPEALVKLLRAERASLLTDQTRAIRDHYAVADTLALHFQERRKRVLTALFTIAVAAVFLFEIYAHVLTEPPMLLLYPLALLLGLLVYRYAHAHDFHGRHLDYRALAEGLRVQFCWKLAGLEDEVSDHYLRKQRTELEWVRTALRTQLRLGEWQPGASKDMEPPLSAAQEAIAKVVEPCWVENQLGFFERNSIRNHDKVANRERWALVLLFAGMLAGTLVLATPYFVVQPYLANWNHGLIVLMGLTPAIAAAMGGYAERMAFAPQAKRYRWMAELFKRTETRLREAIEKGKTGDAQRLIRELGSEALEENGDWVLMHRERPPEAPKGG